MALVGSLLRLVVRLPLLMVGFVFTHKIVLVVAIIGVVFLIFQARTSGNDNDMPANLKEAPEYQVIAPIPKLAPYVGQTPTRVFYITKYKQTEDGRTVLEVWYDYNKDAWVRHSTPLTLDSDKIVVMKRGY